MSERSRGYAHRVDINADVARVWRTRCSPDAELQPRQGGLFRAKVDRVTEL